MPNRFRRILGRIRGWHVIELNCKSLSEPGFAFIAFRGCQREGQGKGPVNTGFFPLYPPQADSRSGARCCDRDYPVLRAGNPTIAPSDGVCNRCSQSMLVLTTCCGSLSTSMRTAQRFRHIGDDRQSQYGRRSPFEPFPLAPFKEINPWLNDVAPGFTRPVQRRAVSIVRQGGCRDPVGNATHRF